MKTGRTSLVWSLAGLCWLGLSARADDMALPAPAPPVLTLDAAVLWALQNSPELASARQQHGIASAAVVIAETFPFNPSLESRIQSASGPHSAAITNRTPNEHLLFFTLELCGQAEFRRLGASAALTRTDWEIASQEQAVAVRVIRAFNASIYQRDKLKLAEETVRLNEEAERNARALVGQGRLRGADLLLARTEVDSARTGLGPVRAAATAARAEIARALGTGLDGFELRAPALSGLPVIDPDSLRLAALDRRADLQARRAAVVEADALLRLERANRFGNPTIGPAYGYDPSGVQLLGGQINIPLPVYNLRRGEILQRQAERERAALEVRRTEVQIIQDVQAGIARLRDAAEVLDLYQKEVLPSLASSLEGIEKLFVQGEQGVDILRVIDIRRKLLRARDTYLDAINEANQALADLAAAVGDPVLAIGPRPKP
jgi:cobalt-zinc-cadmium efflux system outer membrane protein